MVRQSGGETLHIFKYVSPLTSQQVVSPILSPPAEGESGHGDQQHKVLRPCRSVPTARLTDVEPKKTISCFNWCLYFFLLQLLWDTMRINCEVLWSWSRTDNLVWGDICRQRQYGSLSKAWHCCCGPNRMTSLLSAAVNKASTNDSKSTDTTETAKIRPNRIINDHLLKSLLMGPLGVNNYLLAFFHLIYSSLIFIQCENCFLLWRLSRAANINILSMNLPIIFRIN